MRKLGLGLVVLGSLAFTAEADNFHQASNASEFAAAILNQMALNKGVSVGRLRVAKEAGLTVIRFNDEYLVDEAEIAFVKFQFRCFHNLSLI